MTGRPHYHRCSECPSAVLCTKQGEHPEPTCIKCRRAERERCQSAPFQVLPFRFIHAEDWEPVNPAIAALEYLSARYASPRDGA